MTRTAPLRHPFALAALAIPFRVDFYLATAWGSVDLLPDVLGAALLLLAAGRLRNTDPLAVVVQGMAAAVVFIDTLRFLNLVGQPGDSGAIALDLASLLVWMAMVWLLCKIIIRHGGDRQLVTWAVFARGLFVAQGAANWGVTLLLLLAQGSLRDPTTLTWKILTTAILVYVAWVFLVAATRLDPQHPLDLRDRPRLQRPLG